MKFNKDLQNIIEELIDNVEKKQLTELNLDGYDLYSIPNQLISCNSLLTLFISRNNISKIENLPSSLKSIIISGNNISKIENLPESLLSINLGGNRVSIIENLPSKLETLNLYNNNIARIENLPLNLKYLNLGRNEIEKIENLPINLEHLSLNNNKIEKIEKIPNSLKSIDLQNNRINYLPKIKYNFKNLLLSGNMIINLPDYMIGGPFNNSAIEVTSWFESLEKGYSRNQIVKLIVLGNSNVGKSSLVDALQNGFCMNDKPSTHGIIRNALKISDGKLEVECEIFDFGGQEIYHGTHQAFLHIWSVQLIVFDAISEQLSYTPDRLTDNFNRNIKLMYWFEMLKNRATLDSTIIVFNKIDNGEKIPSDTQEFFEKNEDGINFIVAKVSATQGIGIRALRSHILDNVIKIPDYGMEIPENWANVQQHIKSLQKKTRNLKRTFNKTEFQDLCKEYHVLPGSEETLLNFLHYTGTIFKIDFKEHYKELYRELFRQEPVSNQYYAIVDQDWAIATIYYVLDAKGKLHDQLKNLSNGFTKAKYIFTQKNYTINEKLMFLNFMEVCGICFPLKDEIYKIALNTEDYDTLANEIYYVFPEFLPAQRSDLISNIITNPNNPWRIFVQNIDFLPYYFIQKLISKWGNKTNKISIWRTGLYIKLPDQDGDLIMEGDLDKNTITMYLDINMDDYKIYSLLKDFSFDNYTWKEIGDNVNFKIKPTNFSSFNLYNNVAQSRPKELVISYAQEDFHYVEYFTKKLISRRSLINLWYDRELSGHQTWSSEISERFYEADGYIIFVSNDYMNFDEKNFIIETEIPIIRQRCGINGEVKNPAFSIIIYIEEYNLEGTPLESILSFHKGELMPDPNLNKLAANRFCEEFIKEIILNKFLK
ncbi:50S ribosome-binding GTPase [Spirosoma sp. BT702]|uniref:50S ribosome-binding GTPase n=1 Tax=Spirosoma profusum TaxID=2771354 RepID=A0A927AUK6_9BACT|nr:COR domain-containing protein [Spirosoma profusum]MBD2704688.1 50S ribosome-binding GTPase [Spirosoma profusum]